MHIFSQFVEISELTSITMHLKMQKFFFGN